MTHEDVLKGAIALAYPTPGTDIDEATRYNHSAVDTQRDKGLKDLAEDYQDGLDSVEKTYTYLIDVDRVVTEIRKNRAEDIEAQHDVAQDIINNAIDAFEIPEERQQELLAFMGTFQGRARSVISAAIRLAYFTDNSFSGDKRLEWDSDHMLRRIK